MSEDRGLTRDTPLTAAAIEAVARLTKEAMTPKVVRIPGRPWERLVVSSHDGAVDSETRDVPRNEIMVAESLGSFVDMLKQDGEHKWQAVFVSRHAAVAVQTKASRDILNPVTLAWALHPSEEMALLENGSNGAVSQETMWRRLRFDLAACLPEGCNLISRVARVRWAEAREGTREISATKAAFGGSQSAALDDAELPEEVALTVRPFANDDLESVDVSIRCAFEVWPEDKQFSLRPFPNEMKRAALNALNQVSAVLRAAGVTVPVYVGQYSSEWEEK